MPSEYMLILLLLKYNSSQVVVAQAFNLRQRQVNLCNLGAKFTQWNTASKKQKQKRFHYKYVNSESKFD